jgi:hypothetical protein
MADDKATSLDVIKLRRRIELRDLALAVVYPQTRSTSPLPAITPGLQPLQKRTRDYPSPPENVAKPWKKPWDK